MDGERRICGWKFTKTEGNAEAESCLQDVKTRLKTPLRYALVDNCCKVRSHYVSVFGDQIEVKLDVFHAVQRLTTCIPAKHRYRKIICNKLGLFVRQSDDMGEKRQRDTADDAEMENRLLRIVEDLKAGITHVHFTIRPKKTICV